jgi:hypothetical protein
MSVSTRLPGIQFDVVAPTAPEALVRMDIAVFVGFAASGPLQQPVMVEDIAHFEEIFGTDLVIFNDTGSNQPLYAYLPPAVRAFFRNGGRRCWVIRVAGPEAMTNRFGIPGLVQVREQGVVQAYAGARSEGSWSDDLAVGAALRSQSIEVAGIEGFPDSIELLLTGTDDVVSGDLLKLTSDNSGGVLWFFVDSVTAINTTSPPLKRGRLVVAQAKKAFWQSIASPLDPGALCALLADGSKQGSSFQDLGIASPPTNSSLRPVSLLFCERLTMDLFVQGEAQVWSLTDLGFAPSHPRYWAGLPRDIDLYASAKTEGLSGEAAHPRFPICGENPEAFYLPFCIDALPEKFNGPDKSGWDSVIRNGLHVFDKGLFLDPALEDSTAIHLLQDADYFRYQSREPRNPTPIHDALKICSHQLLGIHAALAVEEATIIAVPDAVHRGWNPVETKPLASPPDSSPLAHPEWWHFLDCNAQPKIPITAARPAGQFESCNLLIVDPPLVQVSSEIPGSFSITWSPLEGAVDFLEEATDPDFATAAVIYQGSSGSYTVHGHAQGDYFYRMRREIGEISSNYSKGVGFRVGGPTGWTTKSPSEYHDDDLLSVHSALLRMCAARGDMFAVLAMPQYYRDTQTLAYTAALKSLLLSGEQNCYSFGALYHPWLTGREENDLLNMRSNPPDGAMAGTIAMRSSVRGPWISPANEPLHGVVDLIPAALKSSYQALQDSLINVVRQEPGGFLCLSEVTLSDDPDLSPINVRRLLSFLRKTVLREGNDYVFEPNSDEFRRGVQRGFEILLDDLLRRGAFAGRTARGAFEVITDSSLNTRQAMDNGEFYVLLRVAPSLPMKFLTIRLLQTADRTFVTEGG